MYSWKEFLDETREVDLDSFKVNDQLNTKIWKRKRLFPEIRANLSKIATNFLMI